MRKESQISATSLLAIILLAGCAADPENPSFPLSESDAQIAIASMNHSPTQLKRPLVIVGGFLDPNLGPLHVKNALTEMTRDTTIITVSICTCASFDECRNAIIAAVDEACPTRDKQWTSQVDVIGMSLGGLSARYAAAPSRDETHPRRLNIARLFTISSPHTGATLAQAVGFTDFHRDMQPGSKFIMTVAQSDADAKYELFEYVHLHDEVVGEQYASVPGTHAWWLSTPPLISPHFAAMMDDRILADIARRLRGEEPFAHSPPAPLPDRIPNQT